MEIKKTSVFAGCGFFSWLNKFISANGLHNAVYYIVNDGTLRHKNIIKRNFKENIKKNVF